MTDRFDLDRFAVAQGGGVYEQARSELIDGRKRSHWMWFIFPQIKGLGRSATAQRYAISSLEEARAYLAHPVLGPRLIECAGIVAAIEGRTADYVFGGIDAQKLHSSATLFSRAAPKEKVFQDVLDRYFGGSPDALTDTMLQS